jgi:hypothetical protein
VRCVQLDFNRRSSASFGGVRDVFDHTMQIAIKKKKSSRDQMAMSPLRQLHLRPNAMRD